MRKCIFFWLLCLVVLEGRSQFLTQSADGKGAVILPLNGVAVGFDIGKTEIAVGANNYSKALRSNNNKVFDNWFFGANLSVKNSSGIGNLFKSGDIVPAASFLGFLGFNMNNNQLLLDEWNALDGAAALTTLETEKLRLFHEDFRTDVKNFTILSLPLIEDTNFRKRTGDDLTQMVLSSPDALSLRVVIASILAEKDERLKSFVSLFKILLDPRRKEYESYSRDESTKRIELAYNSFIDKQTVLRLTPFLFGGRDARNFSLYTGLNSSSLAKSFVDTLYTGGIIGIGVNGQIGTFWLGATYAYMDGDNFSELTSKEYTLRTTDTSPNQALISEKKITGYSGKYGNVASNQLNVDLVKEFRIGDTARLITNLYYRGSLASRDTAYLKNVSNFGLGLYFLGNKSKFLGGIYVELPDVSNNIEEAKPESERSIRPPLKKLTFGVRVNFSISSIIGFLNRPRIPD